MIKVTISIVTYNHTISQISKILESINFNNEYKIYIIDNSPHTSLQDLKQTFAIDYIKTGNNLGFGAGHNIAIKEAFKLNAVYHAVINPDIFFQNQTIERLEAFMDNNVDVGLLMPKILYPDGEIQYLPKLIPSPIDLFIRRLSLLRRLCQKRLERYELRKYSETTTFSAPIISGCFSFFRIDTLRKIGLYDDRFFMYFEDFDLSRRINKQFKTIYYPKIEVIHEYERGAQKSYKLFKIFIQSAIKYFNKWGWFFDRERKKTNRTTIEQFR